jgi:hypothetical protein
LFLDSFNKNKHGFDVEVVGWCETGKDTKKKKGFGQPCLFEGKGNFSSDLERKKNYF